MVEKNLRRVDFHGGPVDGHVDHLPYPMKPFLAIKTTAQAREVDSFKVLVRVLLLHDHLHPFVLAVYELRGCGRGAEYHYMRSMIATDLQTDPMLVDVMSQGADQGLKPMAIHDVR